MNTPILKSEFQARRYAKLQFAKILSISRTSVTVEHDSFNESRYGSTTCVCGTTICNYFRMKNAGPIQQRKLEEAIDRPGAVLAVGVCPDCGKEWNMI